MVPHEHGGHSTNDRHNHEDHLDSKVDSTAGHTEEGVWLGLVALGGIYFFFLTERLMGILSKWRSDVRKKKKVKRIHDQENAYCITPDYSTSSS